jgi:soluble lytic murein transglycosylase
MLSRYREPVRAWTEPVGQVLVRLHLRPNHLTVAGLGISLLAAAAFVVGRTRTAGVLLIFAGLFDFFDGALARASGQVTPFGAFLDSVIDRYSDLVVLLGIVMLFVGMPHTRGAIVAMAGLVGTVMVSYTKARAESVGVECNVGVMERPERLICLIAGALLDLLEPALWVLAVLANLTAVQRIAFTRRAIRDGAVLAMTAGLLALGVSAARAESAAPAAPTALVGPAPALEPETERVWAQAVDAYQRGEVEPLVAALGSDVALASPIADYARYLIAEALARTGGLTEARAAALAVADKHRDSPLAPTALILAATLASQAGEEAEAQDALKRLVGSYPDAAEIPQALYLLGMSGEARGQTEAAARTYRELRVLAPASGWAEGAEDRLALLASTGMRLPELSMSERLDRAERLLRSGVAKTASDEAERIARDSSDPGVMVRALRVVADAAARLRRYDVAARALEAAATRAPAERRAALQLDQGRMLLRAGQKPRALALFSAVEGHSSEAEAAEAGYLKGRALEEMDQIPKAIIAYRAVATRHPAREVAGASLWRAGWLSYVRGDIRGAELSWLRLIELPGGRTYRPPALYWAGRAAEHNRGRDAGTTFYRRTVGEFPRSYYGVLATRRLSGRGGNGSGAPVMSAAHGTETLLKLPTDPQEALAEDPGFLRVDLLRRIGLLEFATQELERVVMRSVADPVRLYGASSAYVREERYHLALRIMRRHFASAVASTPVDLPRAFWEILYPFGWRTEVTEAAERVGLDPFLVAAVVREESSYYPRAVSRAGARGLMQLMPGTAQPMAQVRGLAYRDELLDDPRANLELGTAFLAGLLREFGDPRLALAAYNAGPSRLRQWWQARRSSDVEAFVEEIPYDETRLYVKRVILSWEEYRRIYQ